MVPSLGNQATMICHGDDIEIKNYERWMQYLLALPNFN